MTSTRLFADRRHGSDRRAARRRQAVAGVSAERRRVVDRRRGPERRSTLERRGRVQRSASSESPNEHIRNALQLLDQARLGGVPGFDAALARLRRALALLEQPR